MTTPYIKTLESLKAAMESLALAKNLDDLSPEDCAALEQIPVLAEQLEQRYEKLASEAWARSHPVQKVHSYADGPWSTDKSLEKPFYLTEL